MPHGESVVGKSFCATQRVLAQTLISHPAIEPCAPPRRRRPTQPTVLYVAMRGPRERAAASLRAGLLGTFSFVRIVRRS